MCARHRFRLYPEQRSCRRQIRHSDPTGTRLATRNFVPIAGLARTALARVTANTPHARRRFEPVTTWLVSQVRSRQSTSSSMEVAIDQGPGPPDEVSDTP